ncbi:MAG: 7-carboxy-7-deazaguanine synthase QueE [Prevotellaceae bacterium]|jgi:organic radical activating enzyme|nr:7-carboxy-7-deazaguanine synthase QueE [Prevotellaceae bacterium]
MNEIKLKINEIFYSIQGEGANAGMPAIFIRFAGCNLKCPFCDTNHEDHKEYSIEEIIKKIKDFDCKNIIWTGGEPTLQLTNEILVYFKGYYHCIETNGTNPVPNSINYIACSPKVPIETLNRNFKEANEFRYPVKAGDKLPDILKIPRAQHYYISPIDVTEQNVDYCIKLIKENPQWKLSVQVHKILKIR